MNIPNSTQSERRKLSPGYILAITIMGIALAEVIAMVVVYYFRDWPYLLQTLLDATIMVVIIFPLLYILSFKPLLMYIHRQEQIESITQARLRLIQYSNTHELEELLQFVLDEIEALTGSAIGFFHFLDEDQRTLLLQAWSTNTLQNMCQAGGKGFHNDVDQAGVWAEAVRLRQPVIHNNLATVPNRKGMPFGHALVIRELAIPIVRDNRVLATLGVGNKQADYTASDVELVATLADFAWDVIDHKQTEAAIRRSEEKFRAISDWTNDWEKWLDPDGNVIYMSPSCERITGYKPEEFIADPSLLTNIVHPSDLQLYTEHAKITHDESVGPVSIEYRIISREGRERWIEHICRPIFSPEGRHLGRRISSRDVTSRKLADLIILEQTQKEIELNQTLQTIQTDIARDLHDTLGQNIGFLRMGLEHLLDAESPDPEAVKTQLQYMSKAANESYELIRAMLAILQTDNLTDPQSLFSRYAGQVAERSGLEYTITSQGLPGELSPYQIRQLFYIFREALSNVEKHAHASQVKSELIWDRDTLTLLISDNGCGIDSQATQVRGHYGIKFMRERAENLKGNLDLQSTPGDGTRITVSIPFNPNHSRQMEQVEA